MIKYIRKSLSLKIFFLTTFILMGVSAVTYGMVAAMMPMTYTDTLNRELEKETEELVDKLAEAELTDAPVLLEEFSEAHLADLILLNGEMIVAVVEAKDSAASTEAVNDFSEEPEEGIATEVMDAVDEAEETAVEEDISYETRTQEAVGSRDGPGIAYGAVQDAEQRAMGRFPVRFADSSDSYTLAVIGSTQMVNQAMEALEQVLPLLLLTVFLVSVLVSLFYSRYLTKPILRLSRVSRQMADLDFDVKCKENRQDEIGILAGSLDELSDNLGQALTDLKEANCRLKDDIAKEREQERRRMAFFAAASHELKTPVTILKGQLEGMIQGVGSYKDRDKYLNRAKEITDSMEGMVQEILTVSRMETGGFAVSLQQADLAELIRMQLADLNELFEKKQMNMEIDLPERMVCTLDPVMMEKVIRNVLVNAVRYSPEKARISVGLHKEKGKEGAVPGQTVIIFRAENSGVRIPEEQLQKVFDAFYRVDTSRNRKSGGSGLGLYIVREILELHHAQYRMENTASGVQFTFWLRSTENT